MYENNNPFGTIHQHPAVADLYIKHGWRLCEIPYGKKGPTSSGWNREGNWVESSQKLPPQCNLGLLHAFSGTMALDIDDWEQASRILGDSGISLQALYDAPDAVTIESGKPGHGKLLYATPFPGYQLPSKKITINGQTVLELRSGTSAGTSVQDVLPPSLHPDTRQSYRWGGKGRWDNLPVIPVPLLEYWQQQLAVPASVSTPSPINTDWAEIEVALRAIPADSDRETWLHIGMALHHYGTQTQSIDHAYRVFSTWSAGDPANPPSNYLGQRDVDAVWQSFRSNEQQPITIGTLFQTAREHGWRKALPDVSEMFDAVTSPVDVFTGLRPVPPSIDLSCIPAVLADRSREIARTVGCDVLVPLFAGLGAVCAAADARTRLTLVDGYEVPPILWLCTIGDPSDKKSPGSKPMMSILRTIEREDMPRWRKVELEWKVQKDLYAKKYAAYLEHFADAENQLANTVTPDAPYCPEEPHRLLLHVQDITSQKLMHHGAQQPRGILCYLDEMNGWCKALTARQTTENTSTWIQGYEGGYARMDRVAAGTLEADPFSVAIFGNIQPDVWREHLDDLAKDGFMGRFLPAPLHSHETRLGQPLPDALSLKGDYEAMVRQVFATPPQTYRLSPDAYQVYRAAQQWRLDTQLEERVLNKDTIDKAFAYALAKGDGTIGRLALVFHLIESPLQPMVSADTVRKAVDFFKSYCVPALRYAYGEIGGRAVDSLDYWLASHILAIAHDESVTMRQLKRSAKRRLDKFTPAIRQQVLLDGMVPLEECNWVALADANPRTNEYTWLINPQLREIFADYRKQILTIRQKRLDENARIVSAGGRTRSKTRRMVPGYDPSWEE